MDLLEWNSDRLAPVEDDAAAPLIADSWLVESGRTRGLDQHRERFTAACGEVAPVSRAALDRFWRACQDRMPREGDIFPRAELVDDGAPRLRLRLRPAPERGRELRVWVPDRPDPRRWPRRKGPDLDRLARLRDEAHAAGADEALLIDDAGRVLESTTAGLIWWDGDRLCVVDQTLPVLSSVTVRLLRAVAGRVGVPVRAARPRPEDLDGRETWLVNALHGIRPVVEWRGTPVRPGPPDRAPRWQRRWQELAT